MQFTFSKRQALCARHARTRKTRLEVCARRDPHALYVYPCVHPSRRGARPLIPEFQCRAEAGAQGPRARERESADGIRTDAWGAPPRSG